MEYEVSSEKVNRREDSSQKIFPLEKMNSLVAKDIEFLKVADGRATLGPITPDPDRENGELLFDFKSPLTWVSSPPALGFSSSSKTNEVFGVDDMSPRTPKKDVFDPFAPGPEELMLAPRKKYMDESRSSVARRLNFESFDKDGDGCSNTHEEMFLESVYETLLEAIISKQAEEVVAEPSSPISGPNGFKTPTSLPLLGGIGSTCPGAPMKAARKTMKIDEGICRKLEF